MVPRRSTMNHPTPSVEYFDAARRDAYSDFRDTLRRIVRDEGARRLCDVGGGANPTFPLDEVREKGLAYTLLDISQAELDKAPAGYEKVRADIGASAFSLDGDFDLVMSQQLAEHVRDGEAFHRNVFRLLRPGGRAVHYFPTLFSLPLVVNRVLPEVLLQRMIETLWPHRASEGKHARFPAWYSWCLGPGDVQFRRFASLGYEVERYAGFFGHSYYNAIPPLRDAHRWISSKIVDHPVWLLTSGAVVVLRRPKHS